MNKQISATTSTSTQLTPGQQTALCRTVFDALMDQDHLGFLLSSRHLSIFMSQGNLDAPAKDVALARTVAGTESVFHAFHQAMLTMYAGVHIEECKYEHRESLMLDLDQQLAEALAGIEMIASNQEQLDQVDLAWRYRRVCSSGTKINL